MAPTMPRNRQFVLHLGHRTAMGAEDFLVADSNAEAVSWIDRWPDWPAPALTVWGPAGAGKTHLAHVWQARSGAVPVPPLALAEANPVNLLGGRQHLVIDGADKAVDELALLHLYNLLANRGGSLLLTAAAPPSRWRLRDRRPRFAPLGGARPPRSARPTTACWKPCSPSSSPTGRSKSARMCSTCCCAGSNAVSPRRAVR